MILAFSSETKSTRLETSLLSSSNEEHDLSVVKPRPL